jgi:DNA-binding GntR family transcriptional regulator
MPAWTAADAAVGAPLRGTAAPEGHGGDVQLQRKRKKKSIGYREISAILIGEIQSGRWSVNDLMPTEMELVDRFGVGRNTVREALRELQDLGFIKRRRGARSVLATVRPDSGFVNSVRSVDELLDYAKTAKATVLVSENIRVDEALGRRLDIPAGSEWMRVGILRSREPNGPAFAYSEVYLDPRYADVVGKLESEGEIYTQIERLHGVVIRRVVQEIEAILADANIASRLNVEIGTAILLVRTKFHTSDGRLVEIGLAHFPAGRYRVRIALDRRAHQ